MSSDKKNDRKAEPPVIVAITASAARTRSLEALLERLPRQGNAALVVVLQHREALDDDRFRAAVAGGGHEMAELTDGTTVEAGRLYVPGEGVIATLEGGQFRARPTAEAPGDRGVIDSFLVSLAHEIGTRAILVALDGSDGDGTLGVKEMKETGGLALAEETEESRAGELAISNSPAALADAVLPVDELAARLASLLDQAEAAPADAAPATSDTPGMTEALATIASILRQRTGHDFHGYKPGTFVRRVQRRMQVLQLETVEAYIEALRGEPNEAQDLFNDLLIGVTEFFRDKREWELLEREVIPGLFEGKTAGDQLRVWVVGCSTGEEAYSIALLLAEQRARAQDPPQIQIFASDLDGRALASARVGRYSDTIASQMSPERLGRWFVKEGDTYCVSKELREMCIFSQHSIIRDAPFSRLDLVSCRNLLIYLDAELQEQVIPLFHFALRPNGVLFLGNSENATRHADLFTPAATHSRIFRRLDRTTRAFPVFPFTSVNRRVPVQAGTVPRTGRPRADADDVTRRAQRIVERHAPAYVILDDAQTVLHFSANMGQYIAPAGGTASLNLLQLIHPHLRLDLRTALAGAAEENRSVEVNGLEFEANGRRVAVDVAVEPVQGDADVPSSYVILFKESARERDGDARRAPGVDQNEHVLRLEDELRLTRGRLQATIEELESANEELKSSNEEYQSLNEELQSANEELETSKEELQSVNEELTTVNGELAHRVQELGRSNSDLKNFLEATRIATLFLDNDLRVTNFTPAITDLFHLVPSDEGRPIGHIMPRLAYDDLQADTRRVLRTLAPVEREVGDPATGARYMVRVLPYRSTDSVIAGVVVTFVDVTARRRAEEALRESEDRFRAIVETARDYAIFTIDAAGRIETWPKGAQEVFGWTAGEALGQPVEMTFTPEDRAKGVPEKERLQAREKGHATDVRWHLRKDGSRVFIDGIVRPLHGPDSQLRGFVKVGQDVTERRATEEALRESEARFRQFGDASADVLWIRDCESLAFEYVSPALEEVYGVKLEHILDGHHVRRWAEMIVPEDRDKALDALRRVREGEHVLHSFRILRADGEVRWIRATDFPLLDEEGHVQRIGGIAHDATEEVELQDRLKVLVAELQHRSRNLVAVVRGVADRTLATSGTLEDFRTRFRPRLEALSRVNSLLSRLEEGDRITFDQLLQAELTAHGVLGFDGQGEQVALQGPDGIRLRSATVQTFALAIHELATNALKHGALSRPEGRLEVGWSLIPARPSVSGKPGERWLKVDWRETGVPPDLPDGRPKDPGASLPRQGYGRELIERALPYQLKAQTSYELTPEGVRCTIVMPVSSALDVAFSSH